MPSRWSKRISKILDVFMSFQKTPSFHIFLLYSISIKIFYGLNFIVNCNQNFLTHMITETQKFQFSIQTSKNSILTSHYLIDIKPTYSENQKTVE